MTSCGVVGGNKIIAVLPDGSKRRFDDLISHTKDIVNDSCRIRAFDAFFGVLRDCFRDLGDVPPKPEVLDIYGRVMVNSFNIMNPEFQSVGIGLYLEASALDHSCRPNATVAFQGKRIAVRCILEGVDRFSDVRISYCNTLNLRERRRKDLREQYYFECRCEECEDKDSATEAKKAACLKCPSCSRGVPVSEADREVTVRCEHCQAVVPDDRVRRYWSVRDEVVEALFSDSNRHPEPSEQCGEFIGEMEGLFHPAERNYLDVLENCYEEALREVCGQGGKEFFFSKPHWYITAHPVQLLSCLMNFFLPMNRKIGSAPLISDASSWWATRSSTRSTTSTRDYFCSSWPSSPTSWKGRWTPWPSFGEVSTS